MRRRIREWCGVISQHNNLHHDWEICACLTPILRILPSNTVSSLSPTLRKKCERWESVEFEKWYTVRRKCSKAFRIRDSAISTHAPALWIDRYMLATPLCFQTISAYQSGATIAIGQITEQFAVNHLTFYGTSVPQMTMIPHQTARKQD